MAKKKKLLTKRISIFVIGMVIGIGLIVFDQFDTISGLTTGELTGLSLIDVPIDPTTGQILGTIKFGAPIEVPFERSGTILSADFIGGCLQLQEGEVLKAGALSEVPFGRLGSGDPNAEVSWHGYNGVNCGFGYLEFDLTELPNSFVATGVRFQLNLKSVQGAGTVNNNSIKCTVVYLSNTLDEITARNLPNRIMWGSDTGGTTTNTLQSSYIPTDPLSGDFVAWGGSKYTPTIFGNIGTSAPSTGDWCQTTGVKSFTFGQISPSGTFSSQKGVDTFNQALQKGSDKFTLGFFVNGVGANKFVIDNLWWEENGSLLVTGTSDPIRCGIGFRQVDFKCLPIICIDTEILDRVTNECITIICQPDEIFAVIDEFVACATVCLDDPFTPEFECGGQCSGTISRGVCLPIPEDSVCAFDEALVDGVCQPVIIKFVCDVELNCQEGTIPDANGCSCQLIECSIGQELVRNNCQGIVCPINTILMGSDCIERSCPNGQVSIDNVCQDPEILPTVECDIDPNPFNNTLVDPTCIPSDGGVDPTMLDCGIGFKQVGDGCFPISLDCPEGTTPQENICIKFLPSLTATSAPELGTVSIIGIVTFAGSFFGLVGSAIRRS